MRSRTDDRDTILGRSAAASASGALTSDTCRTDGASTREPDRDRGRLRDAEEFRRDRTREPPRLAPPLPPPLAPSDSAAARSTSRSASRRSLERRREDNRRVADVSAAAAAATDRAAGFAGVVGVDVSCPMSAEKAPPLPLLPLRAAAAVARGDNTLDAPPPAFRSRSRSRSTTAAPSAPRRLTVRPSVVGVGDSRPPAARRPRRNSRNLRSFAARSVAARSMRARLSAVDAARANSCTALSKAMAKLWKMAKNSLVPGVKDSGSSPK
mmetsp:Transcript_382/g.1172  ORF Transcript_382/g.1172 Transcript_382/m.1172 type:complete len:268 (-) Transcript_382:1222-2025(-)